MAGNPSTLPPVLLNGLALLLGHATLVALAGALGSRDGPRQAGVRGSVAPPSAFDVRDPVPEAGPGTATLAAVEGVGSWRAESIAEALWQRGAGDLADLEGVPGIGPVTVGRLRAAQDDLVRAVHWRPETWP